MKWSAFGEEAVKILTKPVCGCRLSFGTRWTFRLHIWRSSRHAENAIVENCFTNILRLSKIKTWHMFGKTLKFTRPVTVTICRLSVACTKFVRNHRCTDYPLAQTGTIFQLLCLHPRATIVLSTRQYQYLGTLSAINAKFAHVTSHTYYRNASDTGPVAILLYVTSERKSSGSWRARGDDQHCSHHFSPLLRYGHVDEKPCELNVAGREEKEWKWRKERSKGNLEVTERKSKQPKAIVTARS